MCEWVSECVTTERTYLWYSAVARYEVQRETFGEPVIGSGGGDFNSRKNSESVNVCVLCCVVCFSASCSLSLSVSVSVSTCSVLLSSTTNITVSLSTQQSGSSSLMYSLDGGGNIDSFTRESRERERENSSRLGKQPRNSQKSKRDSTHSLTHSHGVPTYSPTSVWCFNAADAEFFCLRENSVFIFISIHSIGTWIISLKSEGKIILVLFLFDEEGWWYV